MNPLPGRLHENAIKFDYPMFSEVMTAQAFTDQLQGAWPRAETRVIVSSTTRR